MESLSKEIIELARNSPSLHNTQPWYFVLQKDGFSLYVDKNHILPEGDPLQRELWLSLGAMIESIVASAAALGIRMQTGVVTQPSVDKIVAQFTKLRRADQPNDSLTHIIKNRRSFRGKMTRKPLSLSKYQDLTKIMNDISHDQLHIVQDPEIKQIIGNLTEKGMSIALGDTAFSQELAKLILPNWSSARRGMHGWVLNRPSAITSWWESFSVAHRIGVNTKARQDKEKILCASGLILITSGGDTPPFWLLAGRLYYRAVIALQTEGYVSSTIAAVVEAASFHEEVEALIGTNQRLQVVLRFGRALSPLPRRSTRCGTDELIRQA